ncbi:MAG: hypothetical protein ACQGVK_06500 [Myxococcota bacterium]
MTAAACLLLALAAADAVAGGLSGWPRSRGRAALGLGAGLAVALGSSFGFASAPVPLGWLAFAGVALVGWIGLRTLPVSEGTGWPLAWMALAGLGLLLGIPGELTLRPAWVETVRGSPWPGLAAASPEQVLFTAAAFAALTTTANGLVRSTLALAGSNFQTAETTLLGGRLIGVLERWLILGFVLAGEATAAALVVSAKSLVRFPELTAARDQASQHDERPRPVDVVTEYFLLGSMTSWLLALLPAALLR